MEPTQQRLFVTVDFPERTVTTPGPRVRAINGYDVPNWQRGPTLNDYLQHLIKDGWTFLCSVSRRTMVFERADRLS